MSCIRDRVPMVLEFEQFRVYLHYKYNIGPAKKKFDKISRNGHFLLV